MKEKKRKDELDVGARCKLILYQTSALPTFHKSSSSSQKIR